MKVLFFERLKNIVDIRLWSISGLVLLFPLLAVVPLHAATVSVNTTADVVDGADGLTSLREAIAAGSSGDTINFDPTVFTDPATGLITLSLGELLIDKALSIDGGGMVMIDANNSSRIFNLDDGTGTLVSVSLSGLILKNGTTAGDGGGILTREALTLTDVTMTGCRATPNGSGGAIANAYYSGSLTINSSAFYSNSARIGGAIYLYQTPAASSITASSLTYNYASHIGGAIYEFGSPLTLINTTISHNATVNEGGGIRGSSLSVYNSTIAYNSVSSTTSNGGGGIYSGSILLSSSIVAYNVAASGPDIFLAGTIPTLTADHSLVMDPAGHTLTDGVSGNIVGQAPLLDLLRDNGGPTMTHMLMAGSPCLNTGANPLSLTTDQRGTGFSRQAGVGVDMGAVDTNTGQANSTWTVDTTDDVVDGADGLTSLREAITSSYPGDTIVFDGTAFPDSTTGTITLVLGELIIDRPLTITGSNNVTINGGDASRIFRIDDSFPLSINVTLSGLALEDGTTTGNGGGILSAEYLTLSGLTISGCSAQKGGALYVQGGNAIVSQTDLVTNTATQYGGAIYTDSGRTVTISGSTLAGNSAVSMAGVVYVGLNATFTVDTSIIDSNTSGTAGVAYSGGTFNSTDSTFSGNSATTGYGGILYIGAGAVNLTNTTISGNYAEYYGGVLYVSGSSTYIPVVNIYNSTLTDNTALSYSGGALYASNYTTITISSSIVGGNSAPSGPDIMHAGTTSSTIAADHTLVATADGHAIADGVDSNIVGQDPLLFPLADYGGPTMTHALKDASPCIDGGDNPLSLTNDQRGSGFPRASGAVDMGAVEHVTNTQLSIVKAGTGTGTVTASPGVIDCGATCSDTFYPGTPVTLNAVPDPLVTFVGWSGDTDCADGQVTMNLDLSCTATFQPTQYQVTATAGANGSLDAGTPSPVTVDYGNTATFTFNADINYHVASVTGCGLAYNNGDNAVSSYSATTPAITSACTVTAAFAVNQYQVTATAGANGSLDAETPSPVTVDHGNTVTFTFNADTGYHVASVTGCGLAYNNGDNGVSSYSATTPAITSACTVTAAFADNQYQVTATAGANGSLDAGTPSPVTVDHGNTVTFTFNADTGYHVASVTGCGLAYNNGDNAVSSYSATTPAITSACTVTAAFAVNQYQVTATAGANGSLDAETPSPVTVDHGNTVTFTFNVDTGYHVASVTGCGLAYNNGDNAVSSYSPTTPAITSACTVTAAFAVNQYQVTATAGANGSLDAETPSPVTVDHGNTVTFTFNADTGYHVASVTGCGINLFNSDKSIAFYTATTGAVTGDCEVNAFFRTGFPWPMFLPAVTGLGSNKAHILK